MKYIKLFENYNKDKIIKANKFLLTFLVVKILKNINFKFIKIKKSEEEDLYFYYEKTNVGEKLIGFIRQVGSKRFGYFDINTFSFLSDKSNPEYRWDFIEYNSYEDALKHYFNLDASRSSSNKFIQRQYDLNIDKYKLEPPISKGNLTDKIIRWLDSGKETTKEEFFKSNKLIKHPDIYAGDNFKIPKKYYYGYNASTLAKLHKNGLIDFKRRGKDTIIVKGENFDIIKAKMMN